MLASDGGVQLAALPGLFLIVVVVAIVIVTVFWAIYHIAPNWIKWPLNVLIGVVVAAGGVAMFILIDEVLGVFK